VLAFAIPFEIIRRYIHSSAPVSNLLTLTFMSWRIWFLCLVTNNHELSDFFVGLQECTPSVG
jgi:hypothetical protein